MKDDRMKYDLTWIVDNMDENYIKENSSTVLELVQLMYDELSRRKQLITNYTLSNGKVFSDKMFYDLLMWKSFEEDYVDKFKEEGISAIRNRLGLNKDINDNWID